MSDIKKDTKENNKLLDAVETAVPAQKDESPASILSVAEGEKENAKASAVAASVTKERAQIDPSRKR